MGSETEKWLLAHYSGRNHALAQLLGRELPEQWFRPNAKRRADTDPGDDTTGRDEC